MCNTDNTKDSLESIRLKHLTNSIRYDLNNPPLKASELTNGDIGRYVKYITPFNKGYKDPEYKVGYITSYNPHYIFVCFDDTGRGQGCNPKDLSFLKKDINPLVNLNNFDFI